MKRMIHIKNPVYCRKFRHIQAYLEPCVFFACFEPSYIQNPSIFRTQDILRTLSRHILTYRERCVTVTY